MMYYTIQKNGDDMKNLSQLHDESFENEYLLKKVKMCGCFYCKRIFKVSEINEWIDDESGNTAVCPYCGIDSVIPESTDGEYELTQEILQEMNQRFF